jgi:6,7-dimethyl-8-ribityllumazine synthase
MSFKKAAAPAPVASREQGLQEIEPGLNGVGLRIGIVMARFNKNVGEGLLSGCAQELRRLGVTDALLITVPGALEIPLALQTLAKTGKVDACIALGCVIRGETYHFEIVANESARGIAEVQLTTGVPIANAVLTTEDDAQAEVRMCQKGMEAAQCAVEMACLLKVIR